jgi:hypothetical protein
MQLRAPAHRVSSRARWYWAARALLGWVALVGVEVLIMVGWASGGVIALVVAVTAVLAVAHLIVMPLWRYRVHRWESTPTAVYTQSGWFTQERRIAPTARIQTVDTHCGPLEQLFRLANVTVTTASAAGPIKIHGLDRDVAEKLVEELTARTGQSTDDGT